MSISPPVATALRLGPYALAAVAAALQACALFGPGANHHDSNSKADSGSDSTGSTGTVARVAGFDAGPVIRAPDAGGKPAWHCLDSLQSCTCDATSLPDTSKACRPDWTCCLLTSASHCECSANAACAAEAASRPGAKMVPRCPPGAELLPAACAATGQNCSASYLQQQKLDGCCDGSFCKLSSTVWTCQPGSADELKAAAVCRGTPGSLSGLPGTETLSIDTPLVSSQGPLPFDTAKVDRATSGSQGCLTMVSLSLGQASSSSCALMIDAGPNRDAQGRLLASGSGLYFNVGSCAGFPAIENPFQNTVTAALSFTGVTCENPTFASLGGGFSNSYCFAGTFELRFSGAFDPPALDPFTPLDDAGAPAGLSLDGAVMRLSGRVCDALGSTGTCP